MATYEIESDVPIPSAKTGIRSKYDELYKIIDQMKVGDSLLLTLNECAAATHYMKIRKLWRVATRAAKWDESKDRTIDPWTNEPRKNGYWNETHRRVWRLEGQRRI